MISVVIPVFDRVDMLRESIDSILRQTYHNFEIIIVTDGSPPETLEVLREYEHLPNIRVFYFQQRSGSPTRGRNTGIREARGEFIAFQDSDDISMPERLRQSMATMRCFDADIVYGYWIGSVEGTNHSPVPVKDNQLVVCPEVTLDRLKAGNIICQGTVMAKRSALLAVGGLKQNLEYLEDWELWLRLCKYGYKFKVVPEPLTRLRIHEGNSEKNLIGRHEEWKAVIMQEYRGKSIMPMKIGYIVPGDCICGGIAVILQHANRLIRLGHDVRIMSYRGANFSWFPGNLVPAVSRLSVLDRSTYDNLDCLIATGWETEQFLPVISAKKKFYFVQADERSFTKDPVTIAAVQMTYKKHWNYFTEAKWIQNWLYQEFGISADYVPNGLDQEIFYPSPTSRLHNRTDCPRILIEGPVSIPWKGVADSYKAVRNLGCEIWMVSAYGLPDPSWKIDKFFSLVPHGDMRKVYSACDILVKMSRIEGFFGPPMEAMACGCAVVVAKCPGWDEYIVHGENALAVGLGDIEGATRAVECLIHDSALMDRLLKGGYETAWKWDWVGSIINLLETLRH